MIPPLHHFPPMDEYFNDGFHSDVIVSDFYITFFSNCLMSIVDLYDTSCVMRKPSFCICEKRCRSSHNREAD